MNMILQKGLILGLAFIMGCSTSDLKHLPNNDLARLLKYQGKDLSGINGNAKEQVQILFDRVRPRDYYPLFVEQLVTQKGFKTIVLLEAGFLSRIRPHAFPVRSHLFHQGVYLHKSIDIWFGGQRYSGCHVLRRHLGLGDVLLLEAAKGGMKQYYAVSDAGNLTEGVELRLALVRIAHADGTALSNYLGSPFSLMTMGPSVEDWPMSLSEPEYVLGVLRGGTIVQKLETLLWISSTFGREVERQENLEEVRQSVNSSGLLEELAKNAHPWIKEAVALYEESIKRTAAESGRETRK